MELKPESVTRIVVHCSATKADADVGVEQIDRWHKDRGMAMVAYHTVIRRDGTPESGRPLTMAGAHALGHNRYTLGVCLVGGLDANGDPEDNFTPEQYASLRSTIENWRAAFPGINDVCGHRDLSPDVDGDGLVEPWEWLKSCPCFDVREWYAKP